MCLTQSRQPSITAAPLPFQPQSASQAGCDNSKRPGATTPAAIGLKVVSARRKVAAGFSLASLMLFGALVGGSISATAANAQVPAVIDDGFVSWTRGGAVDIVLSIWQKGGLMEGASKTAGQSSYLKMVGQAAGTYRSYEILNTKRIGRNSEIVYLCMNFDRGAVYARFLLYHTEKDWVVQNMDFNVKPEALMPWLAIEGDRTGD